LAGRAVPAGVVSSGKVAAQGLGGDEDRLIAGDVGLRRQGVHALRSGQRPRDGVEAYRRYVEAGQLGHRVGVEQRGEHPDDDLARTKMLQLGRSGAVDAQDHIRLGVEVGCRDYLGPGLGIVDVREERLGAGAALDEHAQIGGPQLLDRLGDERHAALSRGGLLGDANFHSDITCCTRLGSAHPGRERPARTPSICANARRLLRKDASAV
jgi:hypothetical protein